MTWLNRLASWMWAAMIAVPAIAWLWSRWQSEKRRRSQAETQVRRLNVQVDGLRQVADQHSDAVKGLMEALAQVKGERDVLRNRLERVKARLEAEKHELGGLARAGNRLFGYDVGDDEAGSGD